MSYGRVERMSSHHPRRAHYKQWSKKAVIRRERHRAHQDPETPPQYRKFCGWEN